MFQRLEIALVVSKMVQGKRNKSESLLEILNRSEIGFWSFFCVFIANIWTFGKVDNLPPSPSPPCTKNQGLTLQLRLFISTAYVIPERFPFKKRNGQQFIFSGCMWYILLLSLWFPWFSTRGVAGNTCSPKPCLPLMMTLLLLTRRECVCLCVFPPSSIRAPPPAVSLC